MVKVMNEKELLQLSDITKQLKSIVDTIQNNVVEDADIINPDNMVKTMKALNHITEAQLELINAIKLLPQEALG
jgi:hypothetical protein